MAEVAAKKPTGSHSRTRSIAFIALSIAIFAVSAYVTIPIGPIPFTLQMFAITLAIIVLSPGEAMCAILGYLVLGAIGVPVFSGMRGGFGVLAGATGGFLWGYIFGVAAGVGLLHIVRRMRGERALTEPRRDGGQPVAAGGDQVSCAMDESRRDGGEVGGAGRAARFVRIFGFELLAGVLFTAIAYVCGCFQYTFVAGVDFYQAFLACVAPFIVVDLCKIVAAVIVAEAVRKAVRR